MSFFLKNIGEAIADFITGFLEFFGNFITDIFETIAELNLNESMVTNAAKFTSGFALALVSLMAAKYFFSIYVLETDGDSDSDPLDILVRASQAIAIISCNTWIFTTFMGFSKAFTRDLITSTGTVDVEVTVLGFVTTLAASLTPMSMCVLIIISVLVIGLFAFCITAGIRGAELALMKILFPIFAVDLMTTNRERWNAFITTYAITFLSYSLQLLCYTMFCANLVKLDLGQMNKNYILTFGWFILMFKTPKWLERFCYSSGIKSFTGGIARSIPYLLMAGRK